MDGSGGNDGTDGPGAAGDDARRRFADEARTAEPDAAALCLLLSAVARPAGAAAALERADQQLDLLAADTAHVAAYGDGSPRAWADALRDVLGGRHGFRGRPADYGRLDSSLLTEVLERRRGLPILLSVVWTEVGRRAGAPVHGVALPGHFMAAVGDPDGRRVLVDPFAGGVTLTAREAAALVTRATGEPAADAASYPAATPLEVVARVLNNIRAWAAARPEQSAVHLWALDLSLLLPRHPARLRLDRARLLVERGDFTGGAAELDSYAEVVAVLDDAAGTALRQEARVARSRLN